MPAPSKAFRWVALLVAVLVVGYGGVRVGQVLRDRNAPRVVQPPPFPFRPGDPFPGDVVLADSAGAHVTSADVTPGKVVLFLDPECEGCAAMSARWQRAVAESTFSPAMVLGLSRGTPDTVARYVASHGIGFPVYCDTEDAFVRLHAVTSFPLEVVVGASGTVQAISDDSVSPIEAESVRLLLSR
jgi:peroxiredoxin